MGVPIPEKFRMIQNLSWGKLFGSSVNDGIPSELTECVFVSVYDVIKDVIAEGPGCTMWKSDISEAFKLIPIHPEDIPLLGFEIEKEIYLETRLVFGIGSGPSIFSRVALSLRKVFQKAAHCPLLKNMLDDFFLVERGETSVAQHLFLTSFLAFMKALGVPIELKKTEGPSHILCILGLEINTKKGTISVPQTRMTALLALLPTWRNKDVASKQELQSIIGVLSWCAFGIRHGRTFLRRLINAMKQLPHQKATWHLSADAKADLEWWIQYAPLYNGVSIIIDDTPLSAWDLSLTFFSDASGKASAAAWEDEWFSYEYTEEDNSLLPFICHKELFSIVMLCLTWGPRLSGKTILVHCDNASSVADITSGRSSDPIMMKLLRELFYCYAQFSFQLKATHIAGHLNTLADALSRPDIRHTAWKFRPSLNKFPTPPVKPSMTW
jgi:hypothetical protein